MRRRPGEKVLRPIHANAGIRAAYRKRLLALTDEMLASYRHWIEAAYKRTPPAIAQDAKRSQLSSREMERELFRLGRQWRRRFDDAAPKLGEWFATETRKRSDAGLKKILKDGGWSVEFQMSKAMRDVTAATIAENVSLIKSIPEQFHTQVEGMVMRSVTAGRDLSQLSKELTQRFGVTRRRAEFIAIDQSNKATSSLSRARQLERGLEEGIWMHSHAGKKPRPTHVKQNGKRFSIKDGWPDPALGGKRIWPGTEPRCRCTWKVVLKGFS